MTYVNFTLLMAILITLVFFPFWLWIATPHSASYVTYESALKSPESPDSYYTRNDDVVSVKEECKEVVTWANTLYISNNLVWDNISSTEDNYNK